MSHLKLTVVAPVFNEEQVIKHFHARTRGVLSAMAGVDAKLLFVVDRCTDNTLNVLRDVVAIHHNNDICVERVFNPSE